LVTLGVTLAHTDPSLVNGQTYYYKVSAVNSAGEGPLSLEAFSTPATVPSAPRGLQAAAGDGFVELNWTAPSYSGPGTLTYHLYRNGDLVWTGTSLERADGELSNGVAYTYKVAAQNSVGWGENSSQVQAMPRAIETVPTSPRGLTVVPGDQNVDLNWTSPYYLGPAPIIYHLFRDGSMIWSGSGTSYHDAPLTKGIQHSYKVAAQNSIGWGPNCTAVIAVPAGIPDAPYGLIAIAGDSKVSLTWARVNYSGPGTLTYHLFRDGSGIWSGTTNHHNDTGLSNGIIHTYKVAASNSLGWSPNSSIVSATSQGPPTAPRGLVAYGSDGLVVLNWTAPSYTGPGTLAYHLFRDGTETWSGTSNSRIEVNLKNGQAYAYMVAASNSIGWSANSSIIIATPQGPPTPPGGLTAISGSELIELNWTAPSYPGPGVLTYHLFRDGVEAWNGITTSHVDTGLNNGQTYSYQLAASNSIGWSAYSSSVSATPQGPPGVPGGLVAMAGNGFVELNWTAPSYPGPGVLTYHLFRDGSLLWSGYGLTHTDSTVTNSVTYSYSVSAQNSIGWGLNSSEAVAIPLSVDTVPSAPRGLIASAGFLSVDLNWTEPSYLGLGTITYHLFRDGVLIWSDALVTYRDAPLAKGVQYLYEVAASNSMGWGANSSSAPAIPIGVPDPPWGLSVVSGNSQASLSWSAGNYTGPGALVYHLFRDGVEVWNGTTTYHVDPGLVNGHTYIYAIAASNPVGWSANSSSLSMVPQGPPSAPRGLTAQVGNELVELTWTAPEYEGPGSLIYHLFRNGASVWSGSELARIDGGLANFVTYSYKVAAQNAFGWGPNSTIVQAMPLSDEMTPSAPRNLVIVAGNENLTLTWEAPDFSNASTVVGYAIYFGTSPGSMSNLITVNQLTFVLEGLNKGQEYYFLVAAQNNAGRGLNSTTAVGTPYGVPSSPTGLSAEVGDSFVRLSWGAPSYPGPGTMAYHLFRDGSLVWSGGESSYNDTSLVNGRTYSYQVAAQNDAGQGPYTIPETATPIEIVVPMPPSVPNGLQIVAGDGQTILTWNAPDQPGSSEVVEYNVYRGTSPDAILILINVTSTTYVDSGLVNGQTYYYMVSAVSEAGEGASTGSVSATPLLGGPEGQDMTMVILVLIIVAIAALVAFILILRRKGG
jgi:fibronectin type 3 domain-containing protein